MRRKDIDRVEALLRRLKKPVSRCANLTDEQRRWLNDWRVRTEAVAECSGICAAYETSLVSPIRPDIVSVLSGDSYILPSELSDAAARKWQNAKDLRT